MSGENPIHVRAYPPPDVNRREILRYAQAGSGQPQILELMESCLEEVRGKLSYQVCSREFPVRHLDGRLDLGFAVTDSADLAKNLHGCDRLVLFGATVGIGLDRLIRRYSRLSPARALLLQAIGAERIESLCDCFNAEVTQRERASGRFTRPRSSPGYGDLPLEFQKDIFRVLDCPRSIGLTLNESLLMSPSKSVTAIIGIGGEPCRAPSGCAACGKENCIYRRTI